MISPIQPLRSKNLKTTVNMFDMATQNIKCPGGMASEIELIRFFVLFAKLRLAKSETVFEAYERFINKLGKV